MEPITLTAGGIERRYLLARPDGPRPSALVLALHGRGATAAWADGEASWSVDFMRKGFAVAIPEGLPQHRDRPPKFLTNPPRWNDRDGSGDHDVTFLATVIEDAARRTGVEPRACVTGFSNGAGMAFRLASERADLVAVLAPVAGHCWVVQPKPSRPIPTLYLIGREDPIVPMIGGGARTPWLSRPAVQPPIVVTLSRWATAIGCETMARVAGDGEELYPGPVEFRVVYLEGHGHHWPGGKGQLGERLGGANTDRVNANEVIGEFFRQYVR